MIGNDDKRLVFERLLSQLTEGALGPSDIQQLGGFIESDQTMRREYQEYCQMHAMLRSEHGLLTAWSAPADHANSVLEETSHHWQRTRRNAIFSAVAAVFVVVAAGVYFLNVNRIDPPFRGDEIAMLSKAVGARFSEVNGESAPTEGMRLRQGLYQLSKGVVEIEYDSGAILVMRAPATFDLVDHACIRLEDGQLAAHVPETAKGFRIESPGATVIDLGTDFAVQAIKEKESEVHVFNGEVLIDLHGDKGKSADLLRLITGEAARVDYFSGMPSGIDLDEQRFLRSLRDETTSYARSVLAMNPAVYYRMEPSGDGTRLVDASSSGTDATIQLGRATAPVWTAGRVGAALALGGPAQQTYAAARRYPQAEGNAMTVAAWIYARSRPRWASIAKNWAGGDDDRGQFHFGLYEDSGELEAHIVDSSGEEIVVRDKVPLPLHDWYHVAFVADGSVLRLYRDGREVDSKPYKKLHRDPRIEALAIGTKLNLLGTDPEEHDFNMWDGRLDELVIFNHAITASQVLELCDVAAPTAIE